MKRVSFIVISLILLATTPLAVAGDKSVLDQIINKIANIKNLIVRDTTKRQRLQNDLEKAETSSGEISKKLNKTNRELRHQKKLLKTLKNNENIFHEELKVQQAMLDRQIQTAYMLGRQPYLKLLLNQKDSGEISRILMYYHFINKNRIQAILDIQKTLDQLSTNQTKIKAQYHILRKLRAKQRKQKRELTAAQTKRKHLLSVLNKSIQTRKERLDALMANKRRLEKTIAQVAKRAVKFPKANFSKLRRRLSWPTHGHVLRIFGTKIEQSELRWGGVLIQAPEGQPVYAIAKGKVVFAKWLSGYGLLLIINHGNGYMTLYGRNHVLYKNEGDIVHRGDLISTVGQTGGYKKPALYFAVRHKGKPMNPALFIRKESK